MYTIVEIHEWHEGSKYNVLDHHVANSTSDAVDDVVKQ